MRLHVPSSAPVVEWPALPEGWYLLALVAFERRYGRRGGRAYIDGLCRVLSGVAAGRHVALAIGLDVELPAVARRLEAWAAALGLVGSVELSSDRAIERAFVGRGFKARLRVQARGERLVNDLDYVALSHQYGPGECEAIAAWERGYALESARSLHGAPR